MATSGGKQPTFRTARAQRTVRPLCNGHCTQGCQCVSDSSRCGGYFAEKGTCEDIMHAASTDALVAWVHIHSESLLVFIFVPAKFWCWGVLMSVFVKLPFVIG